MKRFVKRSLAGCLLAVVILLATAAGARAPLAFSFGRTGGSIMPFDVKIFADGRVGVTGAVRRIERVTVTPQALAALRKLANAERFFSMPASTNCLGTVGGLATNYIRGHVGKRNRTVSVRGGCNKRFLELFEVLKAVAAVSTTPKNP